MRGEQALKNLLCNVLLQVVVAVSGLVLPRFYLEVYGSTLNGMISSVTQFMSYLSLVEAGISAATIVGLYGPLAEHNISDINGVLAATKKFYNQTGQIYIILVLLLTILYPLLINGQVDSFTVRCIVFILSSSNLIDYLFLGKYRVLLSADQKGYVIAITQIVGTILNTVISVIMIKTGFSIVSVKFLATLIYMLRSVYIYGYVKKNYPYLNLNVTPNTKAISQRWAALVHQIAGVALNNTNLVIMTFFGGVNSLIEISIYTIYQMVANLLITVISSISNALGPSFGEVLYRKEEDTLRNAYSNFEFIFYIFLFIAYTCMGLLYIPFIRIYTCNITDGNYNQPLMAMLFTLIGIIQNIRIPGITLICAAGHYSNTRGRAITEAVINIVLALFLVGKYGTIGVLIATLFAFVYSMIHVLWYNNKYILTGTIRNTLIRLIRNILITIVYSYFASQVIAFDAINGYLSWFITAIEIGVSFTTLIVCINLLFEKEQGVMIAKRMKGIINKKK